MLAILFALVLPLRAQEARTALVVGCDYSGTDLHLPSPLHDARALAAVLKDQLGFEVTVLSNPNRKALLDGIDSFGENLGKRGGVGLFYFSGHGSQNEGENYLIPMGANLGFREDLPAEALPAQRVVTRMEAAGNRVNLLFLDACRNNSLPSAKQKALSPKGLAAMNAANGMLIGFATARDNVANDSGDGSLYTNALLHHILTPGLSVTDMLTRVNAEVRQTSGGAQVPFMEVGLSDVFAFVPGNQTPPALPPEMAKLQPIKPAPTSLPGAASVFAATKDAPFVNSLGQEFVPVPGTKVLFCRWDTRVKDFAAFVDAAGYDATSQVFSLRNGKWEAHGDTWRSPGFTQTGEHPVCGVNWFDAVAYCEWLTAHERALGLIHKEVYRLPTDQEWIAAAGPSTYPWGERWPPSAEDANVAGRELRDHDAGSKWEVITGHTDPYPRTSPVGSCNPNALGLFDLGGNVWQWCADSRPGKPDSRVIHGGSWFSFEKQYLQSAYKGDGKADSRGTVRGFRVVVTLAGDKDR